MPGSYFRADPNVARANTQDGLSSMTEDGEDVKVQKCEEVKQEFVETEGQPPGAHRVRHAALC